MNVINRLTLRQLKLNKKRTLVTIIGVILSVAMITGVATFSSSIIDLFTRQTIDNRGNWHANFRGVQGDKVDAIADASNVKLAMFNQDLGYSFLEGSQNEYKPYLFLRSFDNNSFKHLNIDLLEGRLPQNQHEIVISDHIKSNGGVDLQIGDTLTLEIGKRISDEHNTLGQRDGLTEDETISPTFTQEFVITGIIARPGFEPHWAPGYTVISYLDPAGISAADSVNIGVQFNRVTRQVYQEGRELAEKAGMEPIHVFNGEPQYSIDYHGELLAYQGASNFDQINGVLYLFSLIAILIIMTGSVSLIYNAFAISVSERSRHLGMLASVGATKWQNRNSVFFEGMVIGVFSIPLGLLAGTVGMGITYLVVNPLLSNIARQSVELRVVVSWSWILVAVAFSVLTIFISTWIPARRASKVGPIDAIRQVKDIKLSRKAVKTSRLTRKIFGFEAELGLKNLKRNRRRYRATVVSLAISIILFLTVSSYGTFATIANDMTSQDINYDLAVFLGGHFNLQEQLEFLELAAALDGVARFAITKSISGLVEVDTDRAKDPNYHTDQGTYGYETIIRTLNEESFAEYLQQIGVDHETVSGNNNAILINWARTIQDDVFVESEVIDAKIGDTITFEHRPHFPDQPSAPSEEITIAAITKIPPMGSRVLWNVGRLILIVPEETFERLSAESSSLRTALYLTSNNPHTLHTKIQDLHSEVAEGRLTIENQAQMAEEERNFRLLLTIFISGFIALITAICIANILNTISTSIGLRRREFAMLKSVGLTPRGFTKMINYESIFYGLQALLYGLPISLAINYGLYKIMSDAFAFPYTLPWGSIVTVIVAVFAIVIIAMAYSTAQIKKENIIDALKEENM